MLADVRRSSNYGLKPCNFIKIRLQDRCFPVNIAKFLKTPFVKTEAATGCVLKKRCSEKFRKIHSETPVPESLF